jgi:DNA (cytosine-5)-methyltransferase 1
MAGAIAQRVPEKRTGGVVARPKLLDLFCGAGGASVGYHRAGFDVVGVDLNPKVGKHYPFEFHQGDALEYLADHGAEFDAIHASPPCQDHSPLRSRAPEHGTGWLLGATIDAVRATGKPFVIENVMGAKMPADLVLCGEMFGLRTIRHRKFHIGNCAILLSAPTHERHKAPTSTKKRRTCWDAGYNISVTGDVGSTIGGLALDIDWMDGNELSQAIPPAYTQFIGEQIIARLEAAAA